MLGKKHPASSLEIPEGAEVLSSALIKFRMGEENNSLLTGKFSPLLLLTPLRLKVGSPFHAPWVWCEHAVIRQGDTVKLLASGSHFPSHAWYVNGEKVGTALQETVRISKDEPILSTGMPVRSHATDMCVVDYAPAGPAWPKAEQDTLKALEDRPVYKQPVTQHDYTLKDTSPTESLRLLNLSDSFLSDLLPNGNVTERQCTAPNRFEYTFRSDLLW